MTRKKVCGIMIMSALNISSTSGDGPSCSSGSVASGCGGADEDVKGIWSESLNLSSKPLSRINRHFSSSGISTRGLCSVGDLALLFRFFDMGGTEVTVVTDATNHILPLTLLRAKHVCLLSLTLAMTAQNDKERLLSLLHAHGQQFLTAFDIPATPKHEAKDSDVSESEEEWTGLGSSPNRGTCGTTSDGEYYGACNQSPKVPSIEISTDIEQEKSLDGFTAGSSRTPDVTVFLESIRKQPAASLSAKELRKSFMVHQLSVMNVILTYFLSRPR